MHDVTCVLFDLDGTLLDTAEDLIAALNTVRITEGVAPLPTAALRPYVSAGAGGMLRAAYGPDQSEDLLQQRIDHLVTAYRTDLAHHTRLFEGMKAVLDTLDRRAISWGVVTNKAGFLTLPLLTALGLADRPACVISGDTTPHKKPHPEPLLEGARRAGHPPATTVYIGDAQRDIEAGRAAGMRTLAAAYGYVQPNEDLQAWGADGILDTPLALLQWMRLSG